MNDDRLGSSDKNGICSVEGLILLHTAEAAAMNLFHGLNVVGGMCFRGIPCYS